MLMLMYLDESLVEGKSRTGGTGHCYRAVVSPTKMIRAQGKKGRIRFKIFGAHFSENPNIFL